MSDGNAGLPPNDSVRPKRRRRIVWDGKRHCRLARKNNRIARVAWLGMRIGHAGVPAIVTGGLWAIHSLPAGAIAAGCVWFLATIWDEARSRYFHDQDGLAVIEGLLLGVTILNVSLVVGAMFGAPWWTGFIALQVAAAFCKWPLRSHVFAAELDGRWIDTSPCIWACQPCLTRRDEQEQER